MTLEAFALATRARIDREAGDGGDSAASLLDKARVARRLSDALQLSGNANLNRLIPGVGLCRDGMLLFPTILADRFSIETDGGGLTPFAQFPALRNALAPILGDWLNGVSDGLRVLPVSEGFQEASAGTRLSCTKNGCMGPHVRWGLANEGFLTAGHVAQKVGAGITDIHGSLLGTVRWSNDPAVAPSTSGDVDVALVEFDPVHTATTGRSSVIAGAGDMLRVVTTKRQAAVFGFFGHVTLGSVKACYADCYATATKISSKGDSGGLVEMLGDVAGMVIGGFARRDMTLVQTIDYQIREIGSRSGYVISL